MGQLLIRNVVNGVIAKLKRLAARGSKSIEQKMRELAVREADREKDEFWELAPPLPYDDKGAEHRHPGCDPRGPRGA